MSENEPTPFPPPSAVASTSTPKSWRSAPSRRVILALAATAVVGGVGVVAMASNDTPPATTGAGAEVPAQLDDNQAADLAATLVASARSLDGSGNNLDDDTLGSAGTIYPRDAEANYADGVGAIVDGPDERYLSNRIFNDSNQNIFSENGVTHWSFVWGQFIDHNIGLRDTSGTDDERLEMSFDANDPLESFTNDLGTMMITRSTPADGTGIDSPSEQVNMLSSYIDGWAVYGGTDERLDWLRAGSADGDPTNNDAQLLNVDGYLPTAAARPDTATPEVELVGRLAVDPSAAVIAGDIRANENIGLTAVQTLFMREHNRIVESLPDDLDEEQKFAIARRVVGALQQYITYSEFLPAMGVDLAPYDGYDSSVDPSISNEFATVGYRAHSQIHGELEATIPLSEISEVEIEQLQDAGVEVQVEGDELEVAIALNVAFANPQLLTDIGLGNMLAGLASELAYANDEQIDNQLRSVLFQIPGPDVDDPLECLDGPTLPGCFSVVNDLGATDVLRGADHGMPTYNDLREAYGLSSLSSFADLTGEATEDFPDDPSIDATNPIDDPAILDFVSLADADGNELELGSQDAANLTVTAVRRTSTAARLKAIFSDVDAVDAFTGMVSEPHVPETEFGELQLAMWSRQFTALRDGDRFFFDNDPMLDAISEEYGIDYRRTLADIIVANSDVEAADIPTNVFVLGAAAGTDTPAEEDGAGSGSDTSNGSSTDVDTEHSPANDSDRPPRHEHDGRGGPRPRG